MLNRLLLIVVVWPLCIAGALIGIAWLPLAAFVGSARAWELAIAFDQVANAATGGVAFQTISRRAAAWRHERRWACILCRLLDFVDKNHCDKEILRSRLAAIREWKP